MKTLPKIALGSIAALLTLAVGVLLYILFGNLSVHKERILGAASDATGFYIASAGPFELAVGREVTLSAGHITIGNPAWPDEHPLATAGVLRVVVDTWSLLSGPIEIHSLEISDAHVNLKSNKDGGANWIATVSPEAVNDAGDPEQEPLVHRIALDNVRIGHEQAGEMLFFNETSTLLLDRTGHNQFRFELDNTLDEATMSASGLLRFGAGIGDLSSARIEFDEATFLLSGATPVSASFNGFAAADLSADKPSIEIGIDVSELVVKSVDDEQPAATSDESDGALLFGSEPLAYSWLDTLNLDSEFSVANADLNGNALTELQAIANIKDAALTVESVEFVIGEGKVTGSLSLAPADGAYALDLETDIENLRLVQLADADQNPATVPPLDATLTLSGNGASLHDIMASSNGKLSGRQDSGQLNLQAMGALFSDFLTSIVRTLNPLAEERTYTNLECGIFDVDITDGVANIEKFALQSDRLTIVSSGKVDFETESLDLVLSTKSREGLGVSVGDVANSFIKLGGTLKQPSLGLDAAGSVTTTGAALATGGLSLLAKGLWDRVSSEIDLCAQEDETPAQ